MPTPGGMGFSIDAEQRMREEATLLATCELEPRHTGGYFFAREVFNATRVGNTYINRNMVGAVVGVNPFGGQGLSGTGPKAGGPHYLLRFATEKTRTDNVVAKGGNTQLFNLQDD
jgi:delta 1-pyrroline-5-carboxylate dehydrogenase